ncbi:CHASE2 domain-containing protein [Leptolyngbya cf. ectocarpi LEGE 11479]|uniref:CHASE2 domain-containing protein n=1 Tax=Leptolyngbya cf. ectocarpi LEGE 11479 TaxID=1828722 RepID=A0A928X4G0_LEPEC|nr:CHASE2 domain-containing protein [Leptolyngbya ectocarpi]MBE9066993.1 CHASE2 domain-containing protein [Leptolyngbya cf. ectocarpi LEGE 11479]
MRASFFKQRLIDDFRGLLPGLPIVGVVVAARLLGFFQPFEWQALDAGLRSRPAEATDQHITIVAITEADIQAIGEYPLPGSVLADLLTEVNQYQPTVMGLDIFRDIPIEPGHDDFIQTIQTLDNLIVINKILPPSSIPPPAGAPESRIGFVDTLLDNDGFVRRSLLGATDEHSNYRFSFTLRLAERYLAQADLMLENGVRNPAAMRFGALELTPFQPNTGGYVHTDAGGEQILINFRSGSTAFNIITYQEFKAGDFSPTLLKDKIVLIGVTAQSIKDIVNVAAVDGINPGLVTGIELQAHTVSQIVNAVLDDRPLLQGWPEWLEYSWIIGWGLLGIVLVRFKIKATYYFVSIVTLVVAIVAVSYGLLYLGWWIPGVPAAIAFFLNGVALYPSYRTQHELRLRLEDRQQLIERTFDQIHNGPLQKLSIVLSQTAEDPSLPTSLHHDLEALNQELRGIYEAMQQEFLVEESCCLQLEGNRIVRLEQPLHEMLYEVYDHTLQRQEFPHFDSIKIHIRTFEPMVEKGLNSDRKREIGRFLEEALCNVGKYAKNCSRLVVTCCQEGSQNVVRVLDNGLGPDTNQNYRRIGRGTQQANMLANRLKGNFERKRLDPHGVSSELHWPI